MKRGAARRHERITQVPKETAKLAPKALARAAPATKRAITAVIFDQPSTRQCS